MAYARITAQDIMAVSATTTIVGTYPNAPTAGNLLVAVEGHGGVGSAATLSDSGGNWTVYRTQQDFTATRNGGIFWKIATASQPTAITASRTSATAMWMNLYEFSGNSSTPSNANEGHSDDAGVAGVSTSGAGITITDTGSLIITMAFFSSTIISPSVDSGFTVMNPNPASPNVRLVDAFRIPGSIATYSPQFSWSNSRLWLHVTAEFLPSGSGLGGTPQSEIRKSMVTPILQASRR